jgi:hypothetical protein
MTRHATIAVGSGSGGGHASSQTNSPEPQPRTDEPRLRTDQHGDAGSQRYSSSVTSSSTRRESSHACRKWILSTSAADGKDTRPTLGRLGSCPRRTPGGRQASASAPIARSRVGTGIRMRRPNIPPASVIERRQSGGYAGDPEQNERAGEFGPPSVGPARGGRWEESLEPCELDPGRRAPNGDSVASAADRSRSLQVDRWELAAAAPGSGLSNDAGGSTRRGSPPPT